MLPATFRSSEAPFPRRAWLRVAPQIDEKPRNGFNRGTAILSSGFSGVVGLYGEHLLDILVSVIRIRHS
jgi:hypothetical protein